MSLSLWLVAALDIVLMLAWPACGLSPSCSAAPRTGTCFRRGGQLRGLTVKSVKDCCSACAAQPGCTTYTFESPGGESGTCKLFGPTARSRDGACQFDSTTDVRPRLPKLVDNRYGPFASEQDGGQMAAEYVPRCIVPRFPERERGRQKRDRWRETDTERGSR